MESMFKYETLIKDEFYKEMLNKTTENLEKWDKEIKIIKESKDLELIKELKEKYDAFHFIFSKTIFGFNKMFQIPLGTLKLKRVHKKSGLRY